MPPLRALFLLIGFAAIVAQVVLVRELLVLFGGAENTLGLMLAVWLIATALGSGVLGQLSTRRPRAQAALLNLGLAFLFPGSILAARVLRPGLPSLPGELVGPGAVLAACLAVLAGFCAVSGWLFSAASRLYAAEGGHETAAASATVYLWEAAGSALGGILASLVLIRVLPPLGIALSVALLNLTAAAWLARGRRMAAVAALIAGLLFFWAAPRLETLSLMALWRPFHPVKVRNSVYGNLALIEREGTYTLYENGVPLFTAPDPRAAEESVHYALLQHPAPRTLLVIGGAGSGLEEAFRHPSLERADYVELDPAILDLLQTRLRLPLPSGARVHHQDGRRFLKSTTERYDVIAVRLPEPQTAQLNRFYTREFFQEVSAHLNPGGVFSFGVASSENFISPERAVFLRCIYDTLGSVFPEVSFLPGATLRLFASNRAGVLARGPEPLLERLGARQIQTVYVSPAYLPFDYTPERVAAVLEALRQAPSVGLNRDLAPVAYYFDAVLWSARVAPRAAAWLQRAASFGYAGFFLALTVPAWLAALYLGAKRRSSGVAAYSTLAMGTAVMAFQILVLLGFQAVYGYVYSQIAILLGMFMAGMSLGAWLGLRPALGLPRLAAVQALGSALPLGLCAFLQWQGAGVHAPSLFTALAALGGFIGGFQFAYATRIYFADSERAARSGPGVLYALDLAGACAASILSSAILIPLFGFWRTAWLIGAACLAPALGALMPARRAPAP